MRSFRNPGFTLIEILIALAVLSGAFLALIKVGGSYANQVAYLRDKTYAHWVALNQITEASLKTWPPLGKTEGFARMGEQEWYWEQTVLNTRDPALRRIEVEVKHKKDSSIPLVTRIGFMGEHQNKKQMSRES